MIYEGLEDGLFLRSASNHKNTMLITMSKISDARSTMLEFLMKNRLRQSLMLVYSEYDPCRTIRMIFSEEHQITKLKC